MKTTQRYCVLDMIRGFALINMIIYHALWDVVYIFGANFSWYGSRGLYIWQQFICCTFILLSGFCFSLGSKKLRRGLIVLAASCAVTVATLLFMPENTVLFGILSLIGSATLMMIPLDRLFGRVNMYAGAALSLFGFILTKNIGRGYIGVGKFMLWLPRGMYSNLFAAYLGFPAGSFSSGDYFPILPWLFLFITGYFLHRIFVKNGWMCCLGHKTLAPLEFCGRHSLLIYLLHQPIIYTVLTLAYKFA